MDNVIEYNIDERDNVIEYYIGERDNVIEYNIDERDDRNRTLVFNSKILSFIYAA